MKRLSIKGLGALKFHVIDGFSEDIDHAVFTRFGGVSPKPFNSLNVSFKVGDKKENVIENRKKIIQAMGLNYCVSAKQTHSDHVVVIDEKTRSGLFMPGRNTVEVGDCDALVTNQKGVGLMMQTADCQALLFYDPGKQVIALAHAGWKGLKKDISGKVIKIMEENFGCSPANIMVGIGPSLGVMHSEFSDPLAELGPEFMPFVMKGNKVDLWEFSRKQLIGHGIQERRIENARIDTADPDQGKWFYSYRREKGETGRFAMVAVLR